jgi:hypothetical protein
MIDLPFGERGDNYNPQADAVQFQPITIDAAAVTEILQRHPLVTPSKPPSLLFWDRRRPRLPTML